jgi:hypothetical protein
MVHASQIARAAGAPEADVEKAAKISGLAGGALGLVNVEGILAPVKEFAPGLTGWAKETLLKAARSGVTFATVNEAQEWLSQQIAKNFYDPKAGYQVDADRAISGLLTGAVLGGGHAALERAGRQPPLQASEQASAPNTASGQTPELGPELGMVRSVGAPLGAQTSQASGLSQGDVIGIKFPDAPSRRATIDGFFDNGQSVVLRYDDGTREHALTSDILRDRTEPPPPLHDVPPPAVIGKNNDEVSEDESFDLMRQAEENARRFIPRQAYGSLRLVPGYQLPGRDTAGHADGRRVASAAIRSSKRAVRCTGESSRRCAAHQYPWAERPASANIPAGFHADRTRQCRGKTRSGKTRRACGPTKARSIAGRAGAHPRRVCCRTSRCEAAGAVRPARVALCHARSVPTHPRPETLSVQGER